MAQSVTDVQEALYNQLLTVSGLPSDVQRENTRFKPDPRNNWVRTTLLPTETIKESLGVDGYNRLNGIYQIDLFYSSGRDDVSEINTLADSVVNNYIDANFLTENTTTVNVLSAWRDTAVVDGDWYQLIVFVRWDSQSTR